MKLLLCMLLSLCWGLIAAQTTFYSRSATSGGNWNNVNSWTLNSDGSGGPVATVPSRTDDIVVLDGHTITVANGNANGSTATSPNAQYTVGGFPGNGTNRFYQNGLITVNSGGTLSFTAAGGAMLEDTIYVSGTIQTVGGGRDLINAGYFHTYAGSTLSVSDDFILIANSETILDNSSISSDDIYMDGTSAFLCGDGGLEIGGAIQEFNGADANQQVCDTFIITCTDGDCCDDGTTVGSCAGNGDDGSFGGNGGFTLPVELIHFSVKSSINSLLVEWSTSSELNNNFFTIDRSLNGNNFHEEAVIQGMGNTSETSVYSYEITNQAPVVFIRLSQTDFDGTSKVLGVKLHKNENLEISPTLIYPNPTNTTFTIQGEYLDELEMVDVSGRVVMKKDLKSDLHTIDISGFIDGFYIIRWKSRVGSSGFHRILIKK